RSNLVLEAHFIARPFSQARGNYAGLVFAASHASPETSGSFSLSVNETGSFSGRLSLGAENHSINGQLDHRGNCETVVRGAKGQLTLTLHADTERGTDQVT